MALPAIAGELLPERTRGEAAALLSLRHAGITLALVALAPLVAAKLDDQVQLARERGTAVVLDAPLPPTDKIELAPRLFADIETDDPRDALRQAVKRERARIATGDRDLGSRLQRLGDELGLDSQLLDRFGGLAGGLDKLLGGDDAARTADALQGLDKLGDDLDDVVLAAVHSAFSPAFAVTGAMALLAALLLVVRGPPRTPLVGIASRWRSRCRPATRSPSRASSPSPWRSPTPASRASTSRSAASRELSRTWCCAGSTARPAASAPRARSWCWRSSTTSRGAPTSASTASTRASSTTCSKA